MSHAFCILRTGRTVALALMFCRSIPAEPSVVTHSDTSTSSTEITSTPPLPTPAKPPVDLFRSLLAMTPLERREFLAKRSPEAQKLILAKIQEYQGLSPELRELRLRVTELRWYLLPLLNTPAAERAPRLSGIPAELRELVETRLHEWDKLSPELQKQFLENEATIRFYFELAAQTPAQRAEAATNNVGSATDKMNAGIQHWQALSDDQRQDILRHFYQYFDLTPAEKERTLSTLSEAEREQLEKTLQTFGGLTPAQRIQCVRSFQKFASFTSEERRQFLHNAERWERMSPTDRQTWRNLVSSLAHQPPLPPGLNQPPVPVLPMPKVLNATRPSPSWATNN